MPVVVLAQAWRGGPQHQIRRVLKGCNILADNQHIGRALGVARATSGTAAGEDAIVIATAVRRQAPVVTSDLTHVAESIGVKVRLYSRLPSRRRMAAVCRQSRAQPGNGTPAPDPIDGPCRSPERGLAEAPLKKVRGVHAIRAHRTL